MDTNHKIISHKRHGILSLILFTLAICIAVGSLFSQSAWLAVLYMAVIVLSSTVILYAYCCKCRVRLDDCSHVLPGKLTRLFPARTQKPYTLIDNIVTALGLAAIVIFPQYWLFQNKITLLLFWLLAIIATAEILLMVCKQCGNTRCLMCPRQPPSAEAKDLGFNNPRNQG